MFEFNSIPSIALLMPARYPPTRLKKLVIELYNCGTNKKTNPTLNPITITVQTIVAISFENLANLRSLPFEIFSSTISYNGDITNVKTQPSMIGVSISASLVMKFPILSKFINRKIIKTTITASKIICFVKCSLSKSPTGFSIFSNFSSLKNFMPLCWSISSASGLTL